MKRWRQVLCDGCNRQFPSNGKNQFVQNCGFFPMQSVDFFLIPWSEKFFNITQEQNSENVPDQIKQSTKTPYIQ